jgi:predicted nuclease of restriction endonuclease-like (RecB) superfamily
MSKQNLQNNSSDFLQILELIQDSKQKVFQKVNQQLLELYWHLGKFISEKINQESWGKGTVKELAIFIKKQAPELKGFGDANLWRMRQFHDTYGQNEKLATLWRELSWSHNRTIMGRCKTAEERAFYLKKSNDELYSVRELDRQISTSLFERQSDHKIKASSVVKKLYPQAAQIFKDPYVFDFLNLPENHGEKSLQTGLIHHFKSFILELGRDFSFIGQEHRLQVGNQDFYVDLLFYHRELQCLVAFELKVDKFKPEFMGQLEFYLEALDRDVKKDHENPTIGILLCKDKDQEVVEYTLSRSLSPTLIALYETKLIPREVLQQKLHELSLENEDD